MVLNDERKKEIEEEERLRTQVRQELKQNELKLNWEKNKNIIIFGIVLGVLGVTLSIAGHMPLWLAESRASRAASEHMGARAFMNGQ